MNKMGKSLILNECENHNVYIGKSLIHRWGLFAKKEFKTNDIVTETPVVFLNDAEIKSLPDSLSIYRFVNMFPLGLCCYYNHSFTPNVSFVLDDLNGVLIHYAIRDIFEEEELTQNYGDENVKEFI